MTREKSLSVLRHAAMWPASGRRWPTMLGRLACLVLACQLLAGCSVFGKKSNTPNVAGATIKPAQKDPNAPKTINEWMKHSQPVRLSD